MCGKLKDQLIATSGTLINKLFGSFRFINTKTKEVMYHVYRGNYNNSKFLRKHFLWDNNKYC